MGEPRRGVDGLRWLVERMERNALVARQAAAMVKALPAGEQRRLRVATLRCPGEALVIEAFRVPELAEGQPSPLLLVPSSAIGEEAYWAIAGEASYVVRCRCHPGPVTINVSMLAGVSPLPEGYRLA